jgi:hypothetical protein
MADDLPDIIELGPLPKRFALEYLIDFNGPAACKRAGYPSSGAYKQLLQDPRIQALIREEMNRRGLRTRIDADEIIRELETLAFANPADFVTMIPKHDEAGNVIANVPVLKPVEELPDEAKRAISQIEITPTGAIKLKFYDKKASLELLGKHYGLFNADMSQQRDIVVTVKKFEDE